MLYCKNGRSRSLRRSHKRRGDSQWSAGGVFRRKRLSTRAEPSAGRAPNPLGAAGAVCSARTTHARTPDRSFIESKGVHHATHGCGNRHPLPPGRRRRVRLRLSGRRGPQHLRRAVQAGQGQARAGAPRAGRGARGRRLFARRRPRSASRWSRPGPGVTNAVTGIATAYMDSIPMVVHHRPGARRTRSARTRSRNATRSASRGRASSTTSSSRTSRISRSRSRRRSTSPRTGRPGPVLVDIPKDVTQAHDRVPLPEDASSLRSYNPVTKGHAGQIKKAVQLLLEAKRPMVYAGGGVILERRGAAADAPRAPARLPVHQHADGPGRLPRHRPAVHRHARHARHLRVEHGDAELRRAARRRRALRRPRDRQSDALLPRRPQDHPHRHRPVVDLQAREGRRADRRLRRRRAGRDGEDHRVVAAAARPGRAQGLVGRDQGVAAQGLPQVRHARASSSSRST